MSEDDAKVTADTLTWLEPERLAFYWGGGPGPIRLTLSEDRTVMSVHAAHAFPLSSPDRLVQLFAAPGGKHAVGMVDDLSALSASDRRALDECLRRDRILPEVVRILRADERGHIVTWVVETDRGSATFEMDRVYKNVRRQPAGDVVLRDAVGNRYHVDLRVLDDASRGILGRYT